MASKSVIIAAGLVLIGVGIWAFRSPTYGRWYERSTSWITETKRYQARYPLTDTRGIDRLRKTLLIAVIAIGAVMVFSGVATL